MSMLAEHKTKPSWVLNPRASDWSKDPNKLGQKMLEKMGWSAGKGLGAKEQGPVEAVRVAYKADVRGLGASRKKEQEYWLQQQESFQSLLENLNGGDDQNVVVKSLEERSKTSRTRVHYHKFTRGKDISRYSKKDLSCIVGSVVPVPKAIPGSISESPGDRLDDKLSSSTAEEIVNLQDSSSVMADNGENQDGRHINENIELVRKSSRKKNKSKNVVEGCEETPLVVSESDVLTSVMNEEPYNSDATETKNRKKCKNKKTDVSDGETSTGKLKRSKRKQDGEAAGSHEPEGEDVGQSSKTIGKNKNNGKKSKNAAKVCMESSLVNSKSEVITSVLNEGTPNSEIVATETKNRKKPKRKKTESDEETSTGKLRRINRKQDDEDCGAAGSSGPGGEDVEQSSKTIGKNKKKKKEVSVDASESVPKQSKKKKTKETRVVEDPVEAVGEDEPVEKPKKKKRGGNKEIQEDEGEEGEQKPKKKTKRKKNVDVEEEENKGVREVKKKKKCEELATSDGCPSPMVTQDDEEDLNSLNSQSSLVCEAAESLKRVEPVVRPKSWYENHVLKEETDDEITTDDERLTGIPKTKKTK